MCWLARKSQANSWIVTKLAHNVLQVSVHPGCAESQGLLPKNLKTFSKKPRFFPALPQYHSVTAV